MTTRSMKLANRLQIALWIVGGVLALVGLINVLPTYGFLPRLGPFELEWFRPFFFTLCVITGILYQWRAQALTGDNPSSIRVAIDLVLMAITLYCSVRYFQVARVMELSIVFFTTWDGITALMSVLVATVICWRLWGAPIAIIGLIAVLYLATGEYWPGVLQTAGGNAMDRLAANLWFGSDNGVVGSIFAVILSTVLPFIILGGVLEGCGAGSSMIRISFALMQRFRGGPAYAAILASGMFGTVSGSAVANVVGTGVVTIPMIRKRGFSGDFAGGLESSASAGGQILPPIMGAAALVMADYVGVSYLTVIVAVMIPAIAYYTSLFLAVYFEAKKLGLNAEPEGEVPEPIDRQDWINLLLLLAPLATIVWLLIEGLSPAGASISAILLLLVLSFLNPSVRQKPLILLTSLADGGVTVGRLSMAIAVVGVIVATLAATGIPTTFAVLLSNASDYSLLAALLITALGCIVLGMGMPTLPAYIAIISVMGPTLQAFGMELLTAHMFVFFFGVASVITPPVAIAAYAAASISGGKPMATAIASTRISAVLFLIPFAFAYNPLMLTSAAAGGDFSMGAYAWLIAQLVLALYLITSSLARFDRTKLSLPDSAVRFALALGLLSPYLIVSIACLAMGLLIMALHAWRHRTNTLTANHPQLAKG
ncbi:TRAP transporter permease [Saccharospirillum impatiens]|uniref:TRAP transporter permease n=1 Tax=Saccharospirillum impatiens TaxID=169438 RepID=UPI00042A586C|nr:TRAP transporter fused permease subunit [Saccharospirillum impatiens]